MYLIREMHEEYSYYRMKCKQAERLSQSHRPLHGFDVPVAQVEANQADRYL